MEDFCLHPRTEVRYRFISGGAKVIQNQCIDCGHSAGSFISQKDKTQEYLAALAPWDDALLKRELSKIEVRRAERELESQQKSAEWWAWYNAYLKSSKWLSKRVRVLARDNYICVGCLLNDAVEVHHLTYAHVGNELLFELVSLCKPCHDTCHRPNERSGPPPEARV